MGQTLPLFCLFAFFLGNVIDLRIRSALFGCGAPAAGEYACRISRGFFS